MNRERSASAGWSASSRLTTRMRTVAIQARISNAAKAAARRISRGFRSFIEDGILATLRVVGRPAILAEPGGLCEDEIGLAILREIGHGHPLLNRSPAFRPAGASSPSWCP